MARRPSQKSLAPRNVSKWDRLAKHYHDEVITPFSPRVEFRLGDDLDRSLRRWKRDRSLARRIVLDLGIGCGESMLTHAGRVGMAIGLDFSPGMLQSARRTLAAADVHADPDWQLEDAVALASRVRRRRRLDPEVRLVRGDMRDLQALHGLGDLVLGINSITDGQLSATTTMFAEAARCVRPGGRFIGVFPALDTMQYLDSLCARLGVELEYVGEVDYPDGVYVDPGGTRQKFFLPEEIEQLCRAHGLKIRLMEKILYPWRMMEECGWGYFPRHPRLWDWYIIAERC
jgi:SAM-dependent methyltransferase